MTEASCIYRAALRQTVSLAITTCAKKRSGSRYYSKPYNKLKTMHSMLNIALASKPCNKLKGFTPDTLNNHSDALEWQIITKRVKYTLKSITNNTNLAKSIALRVYHYKITLIQSSHTKTINELKHR